MIDVMKIAEKILELERELRMQTLVKNPLVSITIDHRALFEIRQKIRSEYLYSQGDGLEDLGETKVFGVELIPGKR